MLADALCLELSLCMCCKHVTYSICWILHVYIAHSVLAKLLSNIKACSFPLSVESVGANADIPCCTCSNVPFVLVGHSGQKRLALHASYPQLLDSIYIITNLSVAVDFVLHGTGFA